MTHIVELTDQTYVNVANIAYWRPAGQGGEQTLVELRRV